MRAPTDGAHWGDPVIDLEGGSGLNENFATFAACPATKTHPRLPDANAEGINVGTETGAQCAVVQDWPYRTMVCRTNDTTVSGGIPVQRSLASDASQL